VDPWVVCLAAAPSVRAEPPGRDGCRIGVPAVVADHRAHEGGRDGAVRPGQGVDRGRVGRPGEAGSVLDELGDRLAVALVVERDEPDAREAVLDVVGRTPPRRAVEPVDGPDPVPCAQAAVRRRTAAGVVAEAVTSVM
jgi:hypothetical protein